jgi:hypothetical protein
MRRKGAPLLRPNAAPWDEEEPGYQIPYPVVRHALGKSGPVRIQGLALTRVGDTVVVRPVNQRGHLLQQFIEVPWQPAILGQLARVLAQWAKQAQEEEARLRRRMQALSERHEGPALPERG